MLTIFLSYARLDAAPVRALAGDLRALSNTVWLDEEVSGGQAWWDHILEQIRACDMFVFALSPAALESVSCHRDVDQLRDVLCFVVRRHHQTDRHLFSLHLRGPVYSLVLPA